jgi:hypothetical protein
MTVLWGFDEKHPKLSALVAKAERTADPSASPDFLWNLVALANFMRRDDKGKGGASIGVIVLMTTSRTLFMTIHLQGDGKQEALLILR